MILALDLGTTTGWACGDSAYVASGVWDFKNRRHEGGGMRYVKFRQSLDDFDLAISTVYFEEVRRHIGTDAAHVYGGLMATLTGWCEERRFPYAGVPVGTIKKSFTGAGNANKQSMINECAVRGIDVKDDNEADAVALLFWAMEN